MAEFEEVKASFWTAGGSLPLADEELEEAERILGVVLPSSLVQLLRLQNGGAVSDEWSVHPTDERTSWSDDHVPFAGLAGIRSDTEATSLLDTPYLVDEWGLPSPVVLLSGDGHWWIALDYRTCGRGGPPSVVWLDVDEGEDLQLAPDFRTFVEGLKPAGA